MNCAICGKPLEPVYDTAYQPCCDPTGRGPYWYGGHLYIRPERVVKVVRKPIQEVKQPRW